MGAALAAAQDALTSGDVPVGAVVLDSDGGILGTGHNTRERDGDPTAHAELVALRAAGAARPTWRLDGCTLVVTLEPCTMCAGAIVLARVARLVFGAYDDGRCRRVGVGRRPRPPSQPSPGGRRGRTCQRLGGTAAGILRRAPRRITARLAPVTCSAVACPSGRRSTPRKRVKVDALRGFKSHRHRQTIRTEPDEPRSLRDPGQVRQVAGPPGRHPRRRAAAADP